MDVEGLDIIVWDEFNLSQDKSQQRAPVNTVISNRVLRDATDIFTD
jgi:hypothetical protein